MLKYGLLFTVTRNMKLFKMS